MLFFYEMISFLRDDFVHGDICFLRRNLRQELEGEGDAYSVGSRNLREEAVVIGFAPAQTITLDIECHTRDDGYIYLTVAMGREKGSCRLNDMIGAFS